MSDIVVPPAGGDVDDTGDGTGDGTADRALLTRVAESARRVGDVIAEQPSPDDDESVHYERSARAVLRLIACVLGIAAVALAAWLLPMTHDGIEADLRRGAGSWAGALGALGDAFAAVVAVGSIVLSLVATMRSRFVRQLVTALLAGGASASIVVIASHVGGSSPGAVSAEEWVLTAVASSIAVTSASFSVFSAPLARWTGRCLAMAVVLGVLAAEVSLEVRVIAVLIGGAVGAAAALVFGTPARRVTRRELVDALEAARFPVASVERHGGDARGSQPWTATLATGRDVFVKVTAVDELRSDQLFRFWRRLRLRRAGDERSAASVRRAVEHEVFLAQRAAAAGVSTPPVLGIGALAEGRGMFAVFSVVDGRPLHEVDDLSDTALRSAWSNVQILRRSAIAHRDLRAANLLLADDQVWVIDFGFAEVAAPPELLDRDLAELLVSTSSIVGVERAVANAVAVLGADEVAGAIEWIQPLAVSTASRAAMSRDDFAELREAVRAAAGISAPELPQLQRVSRKAVISMLALGVAIWTVAPQLTRGIDWHTVLEAQPGWAAVALVASALTYVGAAMSMVGSVTEPVGAWPTLAAQVASSFTNRVTPAKVGGLALNVRYLTRQGLDTATATTGVAVSTIMGTVVHVSLTIVAVLWAGNTGLAGIELPSAGTVALVLGAVAAALAAIGTIPRVRRWASGSLVPSARRGWRSLVSVMRTPRNVALLSIGSALVTVANIVAFSAALRAFHIDVAISTVAVVYLAGSALANAAPTPGGLGAAEAALVAGLAVVSVPERLAIPAVLLFRLATFWIPILPGWISLTLLQRRGDL